MFLIRKTIKTDYDYYLNSFKSSHFQFYGNILIEIGSYVDNLVMQDYPNVFKYIVEKNKTPIGFFHFNMQRKNSVEISMGSFKKENSVYGAYITTLAIKYAFLNESIESVFSDIHKDNLASKKIVMAIGGKIIDFKEDKYLFSLNRDDFPNNFAIKILNRIIKEGLMYEK